MSHAAHCQAISKQGCDIPLKKASAKIMFHMEGKHSSIFAKTWGWSCRKGEWPGHKIHPTWDLGLNIFFSNLVKLFQLFISVLFNFFLCVYAHLWGGRMYIYMCMYVNCVCTCVYNAQRPEEECCGNSFSQQILGSQPFGRGLRHYIWTDKHREEACLLSGEVGAEAGWLTSPQGGAAGHRGFHPVQCSVSVCSLWIPLPLCPYNRSNFVTLSVPLALEEVTYLCQSSPYSLETGLSMDLGLGWQPESLDNPTHTHTIALGVTEAWAMSTYLLSKHSSLLGCIPRQASKHLN